MFRNHPKLYQDPHIDYPIGNLDLSFADYIQKSKHIIAQYRNDLDQNADLIIEANSPYELRPSQATKCGALLIHGLLDSPFVMKDIGMQLQAQGLLVRSIVLPGHSTVPGSLLNVKYEDWLQAVRYGVTSLAKEVDQIYLVGFSTGASLSIYHTLQDPTKIAGLIMLSPAYKINNKLDFASNFNHLFSGIWPRGQWMFIGKEFDYAKYRSVCFNGVYQVYRLSQELKKINHSQQPPCPVFMGLSFDDRIVSAEASLNYFKFYSNPKNKMILYCSTPKQFDDARIIVRNSTYPNWNITSFSHITLPVAPTNPHYGMRGDYPEASHVDTEKHIYYGALDKPQRYFYGALYKLKLINYRRQRLTFNPDFDYLAGEIAKFVKK